MLKLHIPDMSCGGCESKIRKALAPVEGIQNVQIDRHSKLIQINSNASEADIIQAIENAGFTVLRAAA